MEVFYAGLVSKSQFCYCDVCGGVLRAIVRQFYGAHKMAVMLRNLVNLEDATFTCSQ